MFVVSSVLTKKLLRQGCSYAKEPSDWSLFFLCMQDIYRWIPKVKLVALIAHSQWVPVGLDLGFLCGYMNLLSLNDGQDVWISCVWVNSYKCCGPWLGGHLLKLTLTGPPNLSQWIICIHFVRPAGQCLDHKVESAVYVPNSIPICIV